MIPAAKLVTILFFNFILPLHQIIFVTVTIIVIIVSYHFAFIALCFAMSSFFSFFLLILILSILPRPSSHQPISFFPFPILSQLSARSLLFPVCCCSCCSCSCCYCGPACGFVFFCVRFLMVHVHGHVVNAPCTCTCC